MMSHRITERIPEVLLASLGDGVPALLITNGKDGYPNTAFTWIVTRDFSQVLFGVDFGTSTLENIEREKKASLQVILAGNLVYLIKGQARLVKERLESAPLKMGIWMMDVQEVKDQSWPGVTLYPFGFEWSADQREEMSVMERHILAEMRSCKD